MEKLIYFKLKAKDEYNIGLLKDNKVLYLSEYNYLYRYPKSKIYQITDIKSVHKTFFNDSLVKIKNKILYEDKIQIIHTKQSKFIGA